MTIYDIADPSKVLIVDCSKWQDDPATENLIDFEIMKSMGVRGVILKAGQGLYHDRVVKLSWEGAKSAGLPVGLYWYLDNTVDPKAQANKFLELDLPKAELGIWVDLEHRVPGKYMGWKNWYNFITNLQARHPSLRIGIYTGHYYWIEYTKGSGIPQASMQWFNQFPLWIASYGSEPKFTEPWGNDWTIWQFTDLLEGENYGVESKELDGNYFSGNLEEYKEYFKIDIVSEPQTPDTPTEEPKIMEYEVTVVWDAGASTKIAPNTGGTNYKTWIKGEKFYASDIIRDSIDPNNAQKLWAKISRGEHIGKYVAVSYPSASGNPIRATYALLNPTPPPPVGEVSLTHTIEVYSDGSIKVDGKLI